MAKKHCVWRHEGDEATPVSSFWATEQEAHTRQEFHGKADLERGYPQEREYSQFNCDCKRNCLCKQYIKDVYNGSSIPVDTPEMPYYNEDGNEAEPPKRSWFKLW